MTKQGGVTSVTSVITDQAVRLWDATGTKQTQGMVHIEQWDQKGRIQRAFKFAGITFCIALVSILIPLLHFILVPSFLLATPVVFFIMYSQESVVLGGEGKCPNCGAEFKIAKGSNKFPMNDVCIQCRGFVKVEKSIG